MLYITVIQTILSGLRDPTKGDGKPQVSGKGYTPVSRTDTMPSNPGSLKSSHLKKGGICVISSSKTFIHIMHNNKTVGCFKTNVSEDLKYFHKRAVKKIIVIKITNFLFPLFPQHINKQQLFQLWYRQKWLMLFPQYIKHCQFKAALYLGLILYLPLLWAKELELGTKAICLRAKYLGNGMLQFKSLFFTIHIYSPGSLCENNAPNFGILNHGVAQHNASYQQPDVSLCQEKYTQLIQSGLKKKVITKNLCQP